MTRNLSGLKSSISEIIGIIKDKSMVREAWDKTLLVAKSFCALHVINAHVGTVVLTYGTSMLPTIGINGELLLAERVSTRFGLVGPGDIVLVRSPQSPTTVATKRLIGLEGQSVTYVVEPAESDRCETIVVPKGHVWVEGDNIYVSNDSRKYGPVPYAHLQGKIFWRMLPLKDFGPLKRSSTKGDVVSDEGPLSDESNSKA